MVELFENQLTTQTRQSSKGNQLKWNDGQFWYKADYTDYDVRIKERVEAIVMDRMRRYQYLL